MQYIQYNVLTYIILSMFLLIIKKTEKIVCIFLIVYKSRNIKMYKIFGTYYIYVLSSIFYFI